MDPESVQYDYVLQSLETLVDTIMSIVAVLCTFGDWCLYIHILLDIHPESTCVCIGHVQICPYCLKAKAKSTCES